jgi:hypothetical protein
MRTGTNFVLCERASERTGLSVCLSVCLPATTMYCVATPSFHFEGDVVGEGPGAVELPAQQYYVPKQELAV